MRLLLNNGFLNFDGWIKKEIKSLKGIKMLLIVTKNLYIIKLIVLKEKN